MSSVKTGGKKIFPVCLCGLDSIREVSDSAAAFHLSQQGSGYPRAAVGSWPPTLERPPIQVRTETSGLQVPINLCILAQVPSEGQFPRQPQPWQCTVGKRVHRPGRLRHHPNLGTQDGSVMLTAPGYPNNRLEFSWASGCPSVEATGLGEGIHPSAPGFA